MNHREVRKTAAQFLNAVAVAVLVTGAISPLALGTARTGLLVLTVVIAALLHGGALALSM